MKVGKGDKDSVSSIIPMLESVKRVGLIVGLGVKSPWIVKVGVAVTCGVLISGNTPPGVPHKNGRIKKSMMLFRP